MNTIESIKSDGPVGGKWSYMVGGEAYLPSSGEIVYEIYVYIYGLWGHGLAWEE